MRFILLLLLPVAAFYAQPRFTPPAELNDVGITEKVGRHRCRETYSGEFHG